MKKGIFNDLINFEYPESFSQLSEEENQKYFMGNLMRLSFQNTEKHILLSLSKSKDSFMNRFVSIAAVISGSLSNMENNLKDYQHLEEYESTIFGEPSITECFSYTANDLDVKQYGELSVFKFKKAFYVVYCISRLEDQEETKELFKAFKDSFTPINSNN